jgi:hypothetical protein
MRSLQGVSHTPWRLFGFNFSVLADDWSTVVEVRMVICGKIDLAGDGYEHIQKNIW